MFNTIVYWGKDSCFAKPDAMSFHDPGSSLIYRSVLCSLLSFFIFSTAGAQSKNNTWEIAAGLAFPASEFAETHVAGATFQITYADHRFGKLFTLPKKKLGYVFNSGFSHYFGRTETVSGHEFNYGGYFIFHTYAGGIYNAGRKIHFSLMAGPALGLYQKNLRFNIGSDLSGTYYFNRKWGATAALQFMNETGARPLWSAALKAVYAF